MSQQKYVQTSQAESESTINVALACHKDSSQFRVNVSLSQTHPNGHRITTNNEGQNDAEVKCCSPTSCSTNYGVSVRSNADETGRLGSRSFNSSKDKRVTCKCHSPPKALRSPSPTDRGEDSEQSISLAINLHLKLGSKPDRQSCTPQQTDESWLEQPNQLSYLPETVSTFPVGSPQPPQFTVPRQRVPFETGREKQQNVEIGENICSDFCTVELTQSEYIDFQKTANQIVGDTINSAVNVLLSLHDQDLAEPEVLCAEMDGVDSAIRDGFRSIPATDEIEAMHIDTLTDPVADQQHTSKESINTDLHDTHQLTSIDNLINVIIQTAITEEHLTGQPQMQALTEGGSHTQPSLPGTKCQLTITALTSTDNDHSRSIFPLHEGTPTQRESLEEVSAPFSSVLLSSELITTSSDVGEYVSHKVVESVVRVLPQPGWEPHVGVIEPPTESQPKADCAPGHITMVNLQIKSDTGKPKTGEIKLTLDEDHSFTSLEVHIGSHDEVHGVRGSSLSSTAEESKYVYLAVDTVGHPALTINVKEPHIKQPISRTLTPMCPLYDSSTTSMEVVVVRAYSDQVVDSNSSVQTHSYTKVGVSLPYTDGGGTKVFISKAIEHKVSSNSSTLDGKMEMKKADNLDSFDESIPKKAIASNVDYFQIPVNTLQISTPHIIDAVNVDNLPMQTPAHDQLSDINAVSVGDQLDQPLLQHSPTGQQPGEESIVPFNRDLAFTFAVQLTQHMGNVHQELTAVHKNINLTFQVDLSLNANQIVDEIVGDKLHDLVSQQQWVAIPISIANIPEVSTANVGQGIEVHHRSTKEPDENLPMQTPVHDQLSDINAVSVGDQLDQPLLQHSPTGQQPGEESIVPFNRDLEFTCAVQLTQHMGNVHQELTAVHKNINLTFQVDLSLNANQIVDEIVGDKLHDLVSQQQWVAIPISIANIPEVSTANVGQGIEVHHRWTKEPDENIVESDIHSHVISVPANANEKSSMEFLLSPHQQPPEAPEVITEEVVEQLTGECSSHDDEKARPILSSSFPTVPTELQQEMTAATPPLENSVTGNPFGNEDINATTLQEHMDGAQVMPRTDGQTGCTCSYTTTKTNQINVEISLTMCNCFGNPPWLASSCPKPPRPPPPPDNYFFDEMSEGNQGQPNRGSGKQNLSTPAGPLPGTTNGPPGADGKQYTDINVVGEHTTTDIGGNVLSSRLVTRQSPVLSKEEHSPACEQSLVKLMPHTSSNIPGQKIQATLSICESTEDIIVSTTFIYHGILRLSNAREPAVLHLDTAGGPELSLHVSETRSRPHHQKVHHFFVMEVPILPKNGAIADNRSLHSFNRRDIGQTTCHRGTPFSEPRTQTSPTRMSSACAQVLGELPPIECHDSVSSQASVTLTRPNSAVSAAGLSPLPYSNAAVNHQSLSNLVENDSRVHKTEERPQLSAELKKESGALDGVDNRHTCAQDISPDDTTSSDSFTSLTGTLGKKLYNDYPVFPNTSSSAISGRNITRIGDQIADTKKSSISSCAVSVFDTDKLTHRKTSVKNHQAIPTSSWRTDDGSRGLELYPSGRSSGSLPVLPSPIGTVDYLRQFRTHLSQTNTATNTITKNSPPIRLIHKQSTSQLDELVQPIRRGQSEKSQEYAFKRRSDSCETTFSTLPKFPNSDNLLGSSSERCDWKYETNCPATSVIEYDSLKQMLKDVRQNSTSRLQRCTIVTNAGEALRDKRNCVSADFHRVSAISPVDCIHHVSSCSPQFHHRRTSFPRTPHHQQSTISQMLKQKYNRCRCCRDDSGCGLCLCSSAGPGLFGRNVKSSGSSLSSCYGQSRRENFIVRGINTCGKRVHERQLDNILSQASECLTSSGRSGSTKIGGGDWRNSLLGPLWGRPVADASVLRSSQHVVHKPHFTASNSLSELSQESRQCCCKCHNKSESAVF